MAEKLVIQINGDLKGYKNALKKAQDETQDFEDTLTSIAKTSAIAFAGLGLAIVGAVDQAAKIETMTTQFEVLTGSVEQANKTVRDLQEFSASTPFQLEGIAKTAQQLLSFGVATDEITDKLQKIGDVASATGSPIQDLGFIFGQVKSAAKLTGERLAQLQERAVPISAALAKTLGVAESAVKKMVSNGEIDFATFEKAFNSLSEKGGLAFEGMIKQSKTFAGITSTLKDNFALLTAEVGKELLPAFKKMAIAATEGLQFLRRNPEFTKMAATILTVGAAITGVVTVVATAGAVFLKLRAIMIATTAVIKGMSLSVTGLIGATGIGLLIIVVTDLALNWERRFAQMQTVFKVFAENITNIGQGLAKFFTGVFTLDVDKIKEGFAQVKNTVITSFNEIADDPAFQDPEKDPVNKFFPPTDKVNEKAKESTDAIKAAKLEQVEAIIQQDEELKAMLDELSVEERQLKKEELVGDLETEQDTRDKAIDDRFKKKQADNKKFEKDAKKHGKAMALIHKAQDSAIFKGTKSAFGDLEALTQSENSKLKSIGKIAAVANIAIKTAESAINIYSGFSTIPIIGVPLGIAGAAAAIAFGAEQIKNVNKARKGLLISGGIPGVDSVPVLAQQGELISPAQNFDEVIGSVRAKREAEELTGGVGVGGGSVAIHVTYDSPEASQIITVSQVEDTELGISRDSFKEAS